MNKIMVLGSGHAIPAPGHDNAHLLIEADDQFVLVDCATHPIQKLAEIGCSPDKINDLILTHFHPDHVSGAPLFFMAMWLQKRQRPLKVYGLDFTLSRLEQNLSLYDYQKWPAFYGLEYLTIAEKPRQMVLESPALKVTASPVKHVIPNLGLRFEFKHSGKTAVYTSDTEPCQAVADLAQNADVLIHEAAGEGKGHTSPLQAAEIAARAQVKSLWLIHYDYQDKSLEQQTEKAKSVFNGPIHLACDLNEIVMD